MSLRDDIWQARFQANYDSNDIALLRHADPAEEFVAGWEACLTALDETWVRVLYGNELKFVRVGKMARETLEQRELVQAWERGQGEAEAGEP